MGIGVGDDTETGHFRSGTRGGVDGDQRSHGHFAHVDAFVVTDVTATSGNQTDAFTAVMGGTAAQGNDEVTLVVNIDLNAVMNVFVGRVRLSTVVNDTLNASGNDVFLNLSSNAHLGQAGVGDDHAFFGAQLSSLGTNFFRRANTHQRYARNEKAVSSVCKINNWHGKSSSRLCLLKERAQLKSLLQPKV